MEKVYFLLVWLMGIACEESA